MVKNSKVGLRAIEPSDLPLVLEWRNNEDLRKYFREYREFSLPQITDWYQSMIKNNNFEMFIIVDIKTNDSIGVAGITYIDWVNRHGDVHFYIGKDGAWIDEVYAQEAFPLILEYGFNILNLNKIWAEIYEVDTKKLNFFKNNGFKIDANLRDHYFYKGTYYTSHILSLLRNEYSNE
jgi:RimJ/RimL family protein N-acetyltransferase